MTASKKEPNSKRPQQRQRQQRRSSRAKATAAFALGASALALASLLPFFAIVPSGDGGGGSSSIEEGAPPPPSSSGGDGAPDVPGAASAASRSLRNAPPSAHSDRRGSGDDAEEEDDDDENEGLFYVTEFGWNGPRYASLAYPSEFLSVVNRTAADAASSSAGAAPHPPVCMSEFSRRLYDVQRSHPRRTLDLSRATYIFLDIETCGPHDWPIYNGKSHNFLGGWDNCPKRNKGHYYCELPEMVGGDGDVGRMTRAAPPEPDREDGAAGDGRGESGRPFGAGGLTARMADGQTLVILDCQGHGNPRRYACDSPRMTVKSSISWHRDEDFLAGTDVGFPAPAVVDFYGDVEDWDCGGEACACRGRRYRAVLRANFGKGRGVRHGLTRLHDPSRGVVIQRYNRAGVELGHSAENVAAYRDLLTHSDFCLVPRGDNLFSFRLMESVSAGCIPVILSDGWVLPFEELIPWERLSVRLPEGNVTPAILDDALGKFTEEDVCDIRREWMVLYKRYLRGIGEIFDAHLEVLDRRRWRRKIEGRAGRRRAGADVGDAVREG